MPNFEQQAVTGWLEELRSDDQSSWPPAIRPIELEGRSPEHLVRLGGALDSLAPTDFPRLREALCGDRLPVELRAVMAQLGAARTLRLLHWLAEVDLPDCAEIIASLTQGQDAGARAARHHRGGDPRGDRPPHVRARKNHSPRTRVLDHQGEHRMKRLAALVLCTALPVVTLCCPAWSQTTTTTTTGSVGCTAITQAAANGITARVGADDQSINPPLSVKSLTCLDNFFSGAGLNVVTNLLNPTNLLNAVEMQICNLVKNEWNSLIGSAQCGLTLTGFNFGFGGLGGGLSCPKLSFGGGGPPIGSIGLGSGSGSGLYIRGQGLPPTGYLPPANIQPGLF